MWRLLLGWLYDGTFLAFGFKKDPIFMATKGETEMVNIFFATVSEYVFR
jgi:hypothetical protein